jgi:hypothetical protein
MPETGIGGTQRQQKRAGWQIAACVFSVFVTPWHIP